MHVEFTEPCWSWRPSSSLWAWQIPAERSCLQKLTELWIISLHSLEGLNVRTESPSHRLRGNLQSFSCQPPSSHLWIMSEWPHVRKQQDIVRRIHREQVGTLMTFLTWRQNWIKIREYKYLRMKKRGTIDVRDLEKRQDSRALDDEARWQRYYGVDKKTWFPQQNLYFMSCLLDSSTRRPPSSNCSRNVPFVNMSDPNNLLLGSSYVKSKARWLESGDWEGWGGGK